MKLILTLCSFIILNVHLTYAQSSASCGKCGGAVSANSRVGQRCPHCGVIWGRENTSYSNSYTDSYSYPNYGNYNSTRTGSAYVISNANLRSMASKSAYVKAVVPAFGFITVNGRYGDWYEVEYSQYGYNYTGYIHKSLVKFSTY